MCANDILLEELVMLEHNKEANKDRGGKVDHPPKGSKDIADPRRPDGRTGRDGRTHQPDVLQPT